MDLNEPKPFGQPQYDLDDCDDPGCACHEDAIGRPGDGAAEVTMTEVYDDDIRWGHHPSGW